MFNREQMIAERRAAYQNMAEQKIAAWKPWIKKVDEWRRDKTGEGLTEHDQYNMVNCLENAVMAAGRSNGLYESETSSANVKFLGVQLPVIAALLPTLALNKIATVQALDKRVGGVFYMDVKYGSDKGLPAGAGNSIKSGDPLFDSRTGVSRTHGDTGAKGGTYAMSRMNVRIGVTGDSDESVNVTPQAKGATQPTYDYDPTVDGSTDELFKAWFYNTDDMTVTRLTNANFTTVPHIVTDVSQARIDYELAAAVPADTELWVEFAYMYDKANDATTGEHQGVNDVYIDMVEDTVRAEDFTLKANFSMSAQIDFEKGVGISLEDELIKYLGGAIQFEVDHYGINKIFQASKEEIGTLNGLTVVQDPLLPRTEYTVGFRGDDYLLSGMVYAPYIPLYTTPTIVTADLYGQKGFMSSAGYKMVNQGLYSHGTIEFDTP